MKSLFSLKKRAIVRGRVYVLDGESGNSYDATNIGDGGKFSFRDASKND